MCVYIYMVRYICMCVLFYIVSSVFMPEITSDMLSMVPEVSVPELNSPFQALG